MPATITLKNIPDDIYLSLRVAASSNHRSLNGEAIACLQRALLPTRLDTAQHLSLARALRSNLPQGAFNSDEIADAIKQGRA